MFVNVHKKYVKSSFHFIGFYSFTKSFSTNKQENMICGWFNSPFFLLLFVWIIPAKSVWSSCPSLEWVMLDPPMLKEPQLYCKYASIYPLLLKWKILPFQVLLPLQIFLQYLIQGELIFSFINTEQWSYDNFI